VGAGSIRMPARAIVRLRMRLFLQDRHRTRCPLPRPRRPRLRQALSFFALTETTCESTKKEASKNKPHRSSRKSSGMGRRCMKQNPQG